MGAISVDRIQIRGGLGIQKISDLEIQVRANEHAYARVVGVISKEKYQEIQNTSYEKHVVNILVLEEDGSEPVQPIFSGYPKSVAFHETNGICKIEFILYSGTILLDREVNSRSFQDVSNSYSSIVKSIIHGTEKADVICNVGEETKPKKPLIQYMETDWEYVLRLASHLQGVVYPEVRQPFPRLWFGMPKTAKKRKMESSRYEVGISECYYQKGGQQTGWRQVDFLYYKVESMKDFDIGDVVEFLEHRLIICEKSVKLSQGELIFTYVLGKKELVLLQRIYNPVFAGMSILGKVIKVEGESLRLHLDIDKEQSVDTAYAYDWVPETGSSMYCMPKVGSKVSLYFSSEEESSAQAVNCIRMSSSVGNGTKATQTAGGSGSSENRGSSGNNVSSGNGSSKESDGEEATENPDRKSLKTEHGKEMYLEECGVGFLAEESGNEVTVEDDEVLKMKSSKKISIEAQGKVRFVGKHVSIATPVEMRMSRRQA